MSNLTLLQFMHICLLFSFSYSFSKVKGTWMLLLFSFVDAASKQLVQSESRPAESAGRYWPHGETEKVLEASKGRTREEKGKGKYCNMRGK